MAKSTTTTTTTTTGAVSKCTKCDGTGIVEGGRDRGWRQVQCDHCHGTGMAIAHAKDATPEEKTKARAALNEARATNAAAKTPLDTEAFMDAHNA
jgi:DnaJ-class molecular chaperone